MKVAYSKKNSDVATKLTIFEQTPTEPKKKIFLMKIIFQVPPWN